MHKIDYKFHSFVSIRRFPSNELWFYHTELQTNIKYVFRFFILICVAIWSWSYTILPPNKMNILSRFPKQLKHQITFFYFFLSSLQLYVLLSSMVLFSQFEIHSINNKVREKKKRNENKKNLWYWRRVKFNAVKKCYSSIYNTKPLISAVRWKSSVVNHRTTTIFRRHSNQVGEIKAENNA